MPTYNIHVSARFTKIRPQIEKIIRHGVPSEAEVIYKARNIVYRLNIEGVDLVIKSFRIPNTLNSLVYTHLRKGKAMRSYQNAKKLQELGFHTPTPIAYGEVRVDGRLRQSYYISENLPGDNMRDWEQKPDSDALLRAFAADIVRLHRAGVLHKDFSPGNVIYTRDENGAYRFHYIDLNRMEFGVRSRKKLMSMFRSINLDTAQTLRLAALYAMSAKEEMKTVCDEAAEAQAQYIALQRRKQAFKHLLGRK
ncbi:lipopolysaccharide kinase InaA family protein [uncultured Muribaculum sp.]|uniref:lipopolysaccharide kinase InaA family protein n=1 Tax=uncultured Muribaculum sp. TaxID=1918613 RepID=UPI0026010380|nr:lipopolysaccharide kinase InaA family protein [uncultured Muribaculum sp.]